MNPCPHCQRTLSEHTVDDQCLNAWATALLLGDRSKRPLWNTVPSFTTSIADAFALEESLPEEKRAVYICLLADMCYPVAKAAGGALGFEVIHASALDRTTAFIAAMEGKDDG